jgi:hypothetical protein
MIRRCVAAPGDLISVPSPSIFLGGIPIFECYKIFVLSISLILLEEGGGITSNTTLNPFEGETLQKIHPSLTGLVGSESTKLIVSWPVLDLEGDWKHDRKFGMSCGSVRVR